MNEAVRAKVIRPNIECTNGYIHLIDTVMLDDSPPYAVIANGVRGLSSSASGAIYKIGIVLFLLAYFVWLSRCFSNAIKSQNMVISIFISNISNILMLILILNHSGSILYELFQLQRNLDWWYSIILYIKWHNCACNTLHGNGCLNFE